MSMKLMNEEVDRNFDAFLDKLTSLLPTHSGQYALMRNGEIDDFFESDIEALTAGRLRFSDSLFSIQEITDRPVDLGFFSHAINTRIA